MLSLGTRSGQLRVLAVGAHPDDIEIGCGGTLLKLQRRPHTEFRALVLTGSEQRHAETTAALHAIFPAASLQLEGLVDGFLPEYWGTVKRVLHETAEAFPTDVVLCPRRDDAHQDHSMIGQLVPTVWRDVLILHYEIPKWDGDMPQPTHYVSLSTEEAKRKVELLNDHFPSQQAHDWWDDETFFGLMRLRGIESRSTYAEAFTAPKLRLEFR